MNSARQAVSDEQANKAIMIDKKSTYPGRGDGPLGYAIYSVYHGR